MSYLSEILADSPVGYWRLGESAGGTAASQVNSPTVDMTYENTPTLGVTGALTAGGDNNTAVSFASSSSEFCDLSGGNTGPLQVNDVFTLEVWLKRASVGGSQAGVMGQQNAASWGVLINTSNQLQLVVNAVVICTATTTVTDTTTWHHFVATKNGSTVKLYLDGQDATGLVTNETCTSATVDHYIGFYPGQSTFDGALDEVAIYSTALSSARVLAHYTAATQSPVTAPQQLQPRRGGTGRW